MFTIDSALSWALIAGYTVGGSFVLGVCVTLALPADILTREMQPIPRAGIGRVVAVVRNLVAIPLAVIGIILLFLPGPGIGTIILSLLLADFSSKRHCIVRILSHKGTLRSLNVLRKRFGRERIVVPAILR